jgi:hypothetical protein
LSAERAFQLFSGKHAVLTGLSFQGSVKAHKSFAKVISSLQRLASTAVTTRSLIYSAYELMLEEESIGYKWIYLALELEKRVHDYRQSAQGCSRAPEHRSAANG